MTIPSRNVTASGTTKNGGNFAIQLYLKESQMKKSYNSKVLTIATMQGRLGCAQQIKLTTFLMNNA